MFLFVGCWQSNFTFTASSVLTIGSGNTAHYFFEFFCCVLHSVVVPNKRPGIVQRHCLVHGCPVGPKTRVSKGGEIQPQHGVAHDIGLLCLWDLFHGVDDREGNGPPAAPGLSDGMGRTGTRFETPQTIRDNGTTPPQPQPQPQQQLVTTGGGRSPAAPRDAGHPEKDPARYPPPEWSWNQRFAFGAVGGRKQRNQVREGITPLPKTRKEGTYYTIRGMHTCSRFDSIRFES